MSARTKYFYRCSQLVPHFQPGKFYIFLKLFFHFKGWFGLSTEPGVTAIVFYLYLSKWLCYRVFHLRKWHELLWCNYHRNPTWLFVLVCIHQVDRLWKSPECSVGICRNTWKRENKKLNIITHRMVSSIITFDREFLYKVFPLWEFDSSFLKNFPSFFFFYSYVYPNTLNTEHNTETSSRSSNKTLRKKLPVFIRAILKVSKLKNSMLNLD